MSERCIWSTKGSFPVAFCLYLAFGTPSTVQRNESYPARPPTPNPLVKRSKGDTSLPIRRSVSQLCWMRGATCVGWHFLWFNSNTGCESFKYHPIKAQSRAHQENVRISLANSYVIYTLFISMPTVNQLRCIITLDVQAVNIKNILNSPQLLPSNHLISIDLEDNVLYLFSVNGKLTGKERKCHIAMPTLGKNKKNNLAQYFSLRGLPWQSMLKCLALQSAHLRPSAHIHTHTVTCCVTIEYSALLNVLKIVLLFL